MTLISPASFMRVNKNTARPMRGEVVSNTDDQMLGRIQVKIPGLIESDNMDDLPMIYRKSEHTHGGNDKSADLKVPRVGSHITVEFHNGDIYAPVYSGYWHSENNTNTDEFSQNYPLRYGHRDPTQNSLVVDMKDGTLEYNHRAQDDNPQPGDTALGTDQSTGSGSSSDGSSQTKDAPANNSTQTPKVYLKLDKQGNLICNNQATRTVYSKSDSSHSTDGKHTISSKKAMTLGSQDTMSHIATNNVLISSTNANIQNTASGTISHNASKILLNC